MMKYILVLLVGFSSSMLAANYIRNITLEPMLCVEVYSSVYEKKEINNKIQNVQVKNYEKIISTINPNQTIDKKREGTISCYNELEKIILFKMKESKKLIKAL